MPRVNHADRSEQEVNRTEKWACGSEQKWLRGADCLGCESSKGGDSNERMKGVVGAVVPFNFPARSIPLSLSTYLYTSFAPL